ncbi:hypothetical protein EW145_g6806, partial [Phellinidium pouzarii]
MAYTQPKPVHRIIDVEYEIDSSAPTSPTSISSDSSEDSWSKMSQISRGPSLTRHPSFYIDSGDVVFLVESQLFKAHRHFFVRESNTFRDIMCRPTATGVALMGSSDSCPIELCEVTAEEFARFLWVFYDPSASTVITKIKSSLANFVNALTLTSDYNYVASVGKWSSILRLAHIWRFPKVKELAVREMDKLEVAPVDRAVMAREFEVDPARKWLDSAYAALGARDAPLTKTEGLRLGLDVVLQLAEVRERIRERRRAAAAARCPTPPPTASQQLTPNDLFAQRGPVPPPLASWNSYDAAAFSRSPSVMYSERAHSPAVPRRPTRSEMSDSPPPLSAVITRPITRP